MRRTIIILMLLTSGLLFSINSDLKKQSERPVIIESENVVEYPIDRFNPLNDTPFGGGYRNDLPPLDFEAGNPIDIILSYYDYFPGNYSSFPLVKQPSPAGFHEGGGLYYVFHVTPEPGATRRVYYSYILNNEVLGTSVIDSGREGPEGFAGVDIDYETGNPLVAWHGQLPGDDEWQMFFTFDQYNSIGFPGIWNEAYMVIDNTDLQEGYIWPAVKVGPSPHEGKRRVFIFGTNSAPIEPMSQGNNKYIAYADFHETEEISVYNPEDWTRYEIPYMREWSENYHRAYDDVVVTDDGKVALIGTIFDWGSYMDDNWPGGYSEHDALFALVNDNYGEGSTEDDWTLYLDYNASIAVENPDSVFTHEEVPLENLYMTPFPPRFSATIDGQGDAVAALTYRMSGTQANRLYANQAFVKLMRFNFETGEFDVSDIWPRSENPDAFPYRPWDPEGDGEYHYTDPPDPALRITNSWAVWWWDGGDFQPENYTRIASNGPYLAAVFQESMNVRRFREYNDPNYESWASVPEIYIVVSDDYGQSWYPPIIMNSNPDSDNYEEMLDGMIPSYLYPAEEIEIVSSDHIRLHLCFFSQNSYGSSIQGTSPQTGGRNYYLPIDINMPRASVDRDIALPQKVTLYPNYPNPFNPSTTAAFSLPAEDNIVLSVYNVLGQRVKTIASRRLDRGTHHFTWNGRDDTGREVASGIYFLNLHTTAGSQTQKMLLMK